MPYAPSSITLPSGISKYSRYQPSTPSLMNPIRGRSVTASPERSESPALDTETGAHASPITAQERSDYDSERHAEVSLTPGLAVGFHSHPAPSVISHRPLFEYSPLPPWTSPPISAQEASRSSESPVPPSKAANGQATIEGIVKAITEVHRDEGGCEVSGNEEGAEIEDPLPVDYAVPPSPCSRSSPRLPMPMTPSSPPAVGTAKPLHSSIFETLSAHTTPEVDLCPPHYRLVTAPHIQQSLDPSPVKRRRSVAALADLHACLPPSKELSRSPRQLSPPLLSPSCNEASLQGSPSASTAILVVPLQSGQSTRDLIPDDRENEPYPSTSKRKDKGKGKLVDPSSPRAERLYTPSSEATVGLGLTVGRLERYAIEDVRRATQRSVGSPVGILFDDDPIDDAGRRESSPMIRSSSVPLSSAHWAELTGSGGPLLKATDKRPKSLSSDGTFDGQCIGRYDAFSPGNPGGKPFQWGESKQRKSPNDGRVEFRSPSAELSKSVWLSPDAEGDPIDHVRGVPDSRVTPASSLSAISSPASSESSRSASPSALHEALRNKDREIADLERKVKHVTAVRDAQIEELDEFIVKLEGLWDFVDLLAEPLFSADASAGLLRLCGIFPAGSMESRSFRSALSNLAKISKMGEVDIRRIEGDIVVTRMLARVFHALLADILLFDDKRTYTKGDLLHCGIPDVLWLFVHTADVSLLRCLRAVISNLHSFSMSPLRTAILLLFMNRIGEDDLRKRDCCKATWMWWSKAQVLNYERHQKTLCEHSPEDTEPDRSIPFWHRGDLSRVSWKEMDGFLDVAKMAHSQRNADWEWEEAY